MSTAVVSRKIVYDNKNFFSGQEKKTGFCRCDSSLRSSDVQLHSSVVHSKSLFLRQIGLIKVQEE